MFSTLHRCSTPPPAFLSLQKPCRRAGQQLLFKRNQKQKSCNSHSFARSPPVMASGFIPPSTHASSFEASEKAAHLELRILEVTAQRRQFLAEANKQLRIDIEVQKKAKAEIQQLAFDRQLAESIEASNRLLMNTGPDIAMKSENLSFKSALDEEASSRKAEKQREQRERKWETGVASKPRRKRSPAGVPNDSKSGCDCPFAGFPWESQGSRSPPSSAAKGGISSEGEWTLTWC